MAGAVENQERLRLGKHKGKHEESGLVQVCER